MAGFGKGLISGLAVGAAGLVLLAGLTAPEGAAPEAAPPPDEAASNQADESRLPDAVAENGPDLQAPAIGEGGNTGPVSDPRPDASLSSTDTESQDTAEMIAAMHVDEVDTSTGKASEQQTQQADAGPERPMPILPDAVPPSPLADSGPPDDDAPNLPRGISGQLADFDNAAGSLVRVPPQPPEGLPVSPAPAISKESERPAGMRSAFDLTEDPAQPSQAWESDTETISQGADQAADPATRGQAGVDLLPVSGDITDHSGARAEPIEDDQKFFPDGAAPASGEPAADPDEERGDRNEIEGDDAGAGDVSARDEDHPQLAVIDPEPVPHADHFSDAELSDAVDETGAGDEAGPADPDALGFPSGIASPEQGQPEPPFAPPASTAGIELAKPAGLGFPPPDLSIPPAFADLFQTLSPTQSEGSR